ncbi:hypothetical protein ACRARG_15490 [Pseudooceanicola sp. C21-150M6]|uniref:hypothetical protein n=1 Tax=Pseudooceanicola sp. C21-150M6 TaxID=3434355 RepID=UPI003D7FA3EB
MTTFIRTYLIAQEDGAVTVDWVVLTAGIIGLCMAAFGILSSGSEGMADRIKTYMADKEI